MVTIAKRLNISLVFIFLLSVFLPNLAYIEEASASSYKEITVYGYADPKPGVHWGQKDNGDFFTVAQGREYHTKNVGTKANPIPAKASVPDRIDMRNYAMPRLYRDPLTDKEYPASEVEDIVLEGVNFGTENGKWYKGLNIRVDGSYHVAIYTETGEGYEEQKRYKYDGITMPDGSPKWAVEYHTPLKVTWVGKIRIYDEDLVLKADKTIACVGDTIIVTPTLYKSDAPKISEEKYQILNDKLDYVLVNPDESDANLTD